MPHPTPATLTPVAALDGHDGRAWGVAWSPDGSTLASCGADRTIRLWTRTTSDAASPSFTCTAVLEESATRTIRTLAWSPCGRRLAAACFDATTAVWERDGGPSSSSSSSTWRQAAVLQGHESEVKGVAWSPSGSHLASCSRDKSVWVWEVVPLGEDDGGTSATSSPPPVEYECADVKQGHTADVKAVAWHPAPEGVAGCAAPPGGGFLVSASYDETLRVWADAGDEWVCAQVLGVGDGGHAGTVWCVDFERQRQQPADGGGEGALAWPRLASGGGDSGLRLWACPPRPAGSSPDDDTAWCLGAAIDNAHGGRPVYGVAWAPPGAPGGAPARLASAGGDDAVRVWEEEEKGTGEPGTPPFAFVQVAAVTSEPACEVNGVAWCPTDRDLVAAAGDDGRVFVWRVVR